MEKTSGAAAAQNAGAAKGLATWRRPDTGGTLSSAKFLTFVLVFTLGAVLVQLGYWLGGGTDYVGIDPDDTMRLIEVRDYLAGQGWFDLNQYRLGPDGGTLMHWSRLVDWPIAALIRLYGLFLDAGRAEAAASITWPLLLVLPLMASSALAGYRLGGRTGMLFTLVFTVLYLAAIVRFRPGALDHHNVQLILVAFIAAMLIDPLARATNFAAAAVAGAVALATGAETTPLVAVAAISVALLWAIHGARYRSGAIAFGLVFAAVTGAIFLATTPQALWGSVACDTLSLGYLALAAAGGVLLAASALALTDRRPAIRFATLSVIGALVLAIALALAPQCLRSPLDGLDPLLVTYWISNVREAQSMAAELVQRPQNIGAYYAAGLIAATVCAMRIMRREQAIAHGVMLGLIAVSWVVSAVQIRGMLFSNFLALIPLSALVADLRAHYRARPKDPRAILAFVVAAALSVPSVWGIIGMGAFAAADALAGERADRSKLSDEEGPACLTPDRIATLAKAPPGRILASLNEGPALLRFTPHSVLAANYHRNQTGMLAALRAGMARPQDALELLEADKIRYVVICTTNAMVNDIARDYPGGLYAALIAGEVPGYLEEMPGTGGSRLRVYEMIQR